MGAIVNAKGSLVATELVTAEELAALALAEAFADELEGTADVLDAAIEASVDSAKSVI